MHQLITLKHGFHCTTALVFLSNHLKILIMCARMLYSLIINLNICLLVPVNDPQITTTFEYINDFRGSYLQENALN